MTPTSVSQVLAVAIENRQPVLITGEPGIGKTDIVKSAASEAEADLIVTHPVVDQPIDYKGLPYVGNGEAKFLAYGNLKALVEAKRPTVCFMDDLGQATQAVQAAVMQLILAREIDGVRISDQVSFLAATNDHRHGAGVSGLLEPLKGRFATILPMEADLDEWIRWAHAKLVPQELIAFLRFRPELLSAFTRTAAMTNSPNPRSWAHVAAWQRTRLDSALWREVFSGAVGESAANEYVSFLETIRDMPNPVAVFEEPELAPIPSRPDILYALCGALVSQGIKRGAEAAARAVVPYARRLLAAGRGEFGVVLFRDSLERIVGFGDAPAVMAEMSNGGAIANAIF
ncbi:MAG: ATP-binding protein [Casimicrobium sp.]